MRKACVAAGWGWAAAIVWLSLTPAPPDVDIEYGDKLGHFAGYGLLMFWFSQLYLERKTRIAEVFDMYANTLGVLLGWTASLFFRKPLFR